MIRLNAGRPSEHAAEKRRVRLPGAQNVLIGREADILGHISAQGVAATIWQRRLDADFENWLQELSDECLPELRVTVPVSQVEQVVQAACDIAKVPVGPGRQMLAGDVDRLAFVFAEVMNTSAVRIRLEVSQGVMCPKFHLDNVPARLLCTYKGPGTEYVPELHQADAGRITTMRTGAAGMFRGRNWPSRERTGLLHRSPAVQPGAGSRLLLVIDAGA